MTSYQKLEITISCPKFPNSEIKAETVTQKTVTHKKII